MILLNYLNCAVGKTIDTGHITDCNTNYKTILLMMFNTNLRLSGVSLGNKKNLFFIQLLGYPKANFDLEGYAK